MQNFSERQILWSLCSVVFHAFALKLPIQTSVSVAPEITVSLSSHENVQILKIKNIGFHLRLQGSASHPMVNSGSRP